MKRKDKWIKISAPGWRAIRNRAPADLLGTVGKELDTVPKATPMAPLAGCKAPVAFVSGCLH